MFVCVVLHHTRAHCDVCVPLFQVCRRLADHARRPTARGRTEQAGSCHGHAAPSATASWEEATSGRGSPQVAGGAARAAGLHSTRRRRSSRQPQPDAARRRPRRPSSLEQRQSFVAASQFRSAQRQSQSQPQFAATLFRSARAIEQRKSTERHFLRPSLQLRVIASAFDDVICRHTAERQRTHWQAVHAHRGRKCRHSGRARTCSTRAQHAAATIALAEASTAR